MSAIETFRFGEYTLRPAGTSIWDFRLAKAWTDADPVHRGKIEPNFWTEQSFSRDAYILVDGSGPLLFFKTVMYEAKAIDTTQPPLRWTELFMQFPPAGETEDDAAETQKRIAAGLLAGAPWLESVLKGNGIREIFFQSDSPSLIRFTVKRLGYVQEGSKLRKQL